MMRAAAYLFAQDLHDEGLDAVLDNVQERGGMNAVAIAATYHHARDVFPHNPRHRIFYQEGGVAFFRPDPVRYETTSIRPHVARIADQTDWLAALVEAGARRDLKVHAWTVFLHNTRLGMLHPDLAPQTVHGDRLLNYLCPAQPEVRAFCRGLAADIAAHGVDAIELEALGYMPFDHGNHHERAFIHLSESARFLLGLCFCSACRARARQDGVDVERVAGYVREALDATFASAATALPDGPVAEADWRGRLDGEFGAFLRSRERTVTTLVAEVSEAAHAANPGVRVHFLDETAVGLSGAYATGRPSGPLAVAYAWRDAVDLAAVSRACDGVGVLAYFAEPARCQRELEAYRALLPAGGGLNVILRPMLPDAASPAELKAKVRQVRALGADWFGFYHYGFMRLESLDWIREALS